METARIRRRLWCVAAAAAIAQSLVAVATLATVSLPPEVGKHLVEVAGFTEADVAALDAGRVIARAESGSVNTELAAVAAVKIRSPRARVAGYYGRMVSWVDGKVTLGFGRFSTPPTVQDVSTLTLDADDIEAVRTCKPRNCDVKVGAGGIGKIQSAVDWQAPDAASQVQRAVRQSIVDYVAAYRSRGDAALITYDDASKPVSVTEQWRAILTGSPYFYQYQPALREYLANYPGATLPGSRDILYWVKEDFGFKPTISVVHGVVYDPPGQPDRTIIVQKQIYASHYYDGSLAVATLIDATDAAGPVTYLIYANRSRGDLLKGGFGGLKRAAARDQARKAAEATLDTIRTALEKASGG